MDLAEAIPAVPLDTGTLPLSNLLRRYTDYLTVVKKQVNICGSALEACKNAEAIVIATEWKEFQNLDPTRTKQLVAGTPKVLDGRNCLPRQEWINAGWEFLALGLGA